MLEKLISGRWNIWLAALIGMLLTAPAMNMGLMGDDYLHWSLLTGRATNAQPGSFFGLFTFADGSQQANQILMDSGKLVWWASDHLRIAFWRPLAELSQKLDYIWWPDSPLLMHLHNLLLYGVMILLVGKLFHELDTKRQQAGLATWLFAGNMLHVFAVAWLASRNQMLCGILLALTVLAYHRWRQGQSALYGVLAAVSLVTGLFSAEAAIQTMGYLLAYALFLEQGKPLLKRFGPLLPFIVIVLAWKATHSHLGYGSYGSPGYVDPSSNPAGFLTSLMLRLPALMLAQWYGVSSVMFEQLDRPVQYLYAGGATVVLLGLFYAIHYLGGFKSALARFYIAASIIALAPACAGYPFDRLTVNSDIGASGLLAMVLIPVWQQRQQLKGWAQGSAKYLILLIGLIHVVVFPIGKVVSSAMMKTINTSGEALGALALPDAGEKSSLRYLLLNAPSAEATYYFPVTREYHGLHNPATMHALGPNNQALTLTRLGDTTLRVDVPTGFKGTITRDVRLQPFKVGDTVHMGGMTAEVEALTAGGVPRTVRYRFPDSLDNAHWRFFAWREEGLYQVTPPPPGQSLAIASYDIGKAVMRYVNKGR
ncbi:MAG: hypothetical protein HYX44_04110 [Aquabacterium sp.]|nr:hypothetical protein [Aquabacterium sp.]